MPADIVALDSGRPPEAMTPPATPWLTLSTVQVHATPWFTVHRDQVVRPNGTHGLYQHVISPGAVTVLAIDDTDHVVITQQWIYIHRTRQWRLPGGGVDSVDTDPLAAAQRELCEETGLTATMWEPMGRIHCADSFTNHVVHLYLATGLTQGPSRLGSGESDLVVTRLPFTTAVELAMDNKVPDAGSAHALLMLAARRLGIGVRT